MSPLPIIEPYKPDPEADAAKRRFEELLEKEKKKKSKLEGIETILGVKA